MIATTRLDLVPMTPALADAERAGVAGLSAALGVAAPGDWPPEYYDADDLERHARLLQDPTNAGWGLYYVVLRASQGSLVGVVGFGGRPAADGVVEIGYGVLPAFRRKGIATEAVVALITRAFDEPSVQRIIAETFPHLPASIGVLKRTGFVLAGQPGRTGVLRYELTRDSAAPS